MTSSTTPDDEAQKPRVNPAEMTNEQYSALFTKRAIAAGASRLRRMADDLDQLAISVDKVASPGHPSYGNVAAEVLSAVRNGLANLHLDQIVSHASQADIYRVEASAQGGEPR